MQVSSVWSQVMNPKYNNTSGVSFRKSGTCNTSHAVLAFLVQHHTSEWFNLVQALQC